MSSFADWLRRLLTYGEAVLSGPPDRGQAEGADAREVLARSFADSVLDIAGPPLAFDPENALAAARLVADACWRLIASNDSSTRLPLLGEPKTPSAHLSGDLTLRFLPAVSRRAAVRADTDLLAAALIEVLGRWPLSGVLANLSGPPAGDLEFGGHLGLRLLYAERLVGRESPAWVPTGGLSREWAELVFHGRGRPLPASPRKEPSGE